MNKEIKEKWVKALRSGTYVQGRGTLRTADNYFCCLGVLCDLVKPEGWLLFDGHSSYMHGRGSGFPELEIFTEAWLPYAEGDRLASMNDTGSSFATIAAYIEKNL